MVFVCICLSLMLGISAALPQDMSGKMFIFPQETNTAHVRLTTSRQNLGAVTVCLRAFTDLSRTYGTFSLSTPTFDNDFLIFKEPQSGEFSVSVRNAGHIFSNQDDKRNEWQSFCATWAAASGLMQLWVNGKPSSIKSTSTLNISGPMIIVLGQDQDSHGGGFNIAQSFVGMMTDVHMWDYVLTPCHIQNYNHKFTYPAGNILNWKSLEFQIIGSVHIQKEQEQC